MLRINLDRNNYINIINNQFSKCDDDVSTIQSICSCSTSSDGNTKTNTCSNGNYISSTNNTDGSIVTTGEDIDNIYNFDSSPPDPNNENKRTTFFTITSKTDEQITSGITTCYWSGVNCG